MDKFFFFKKNIKRPDRSTLLEETDALVIDKPGFNEVVPYLAHDTHIRQLFADSENKNLVIRVSNFDKYPHAQVSWLSVSQQWIDKISILPHHQDYYFVLSEEVYKSLTPPASNSVAFFLGKNDKNAILGYLIFGEFNEIEGGGGGGLLHGAVVPPP